MNEVVGIMQQNIERVVERGDRLDQLDEKTGWFISSSSSLMPGVLTTYLCCSHRGIAGAGESVQEGREEDQKEDVVEQHEAQHYHCHRRGRHHHYHRL